MIPAEKWEPDFRSKYILSCDPYKKLVWWKVVLNKIGFKFTIIKQGGFVVFYRENGTINYKK